MFKKTVEYQVQRINNEVIANIKARNNGKVPMDGGGLATAAWSYERIGQSSHPIDVPETEEGFDEQNDELRAINALAQAMRNAWGS